MPAFDQLQEPLDHALSCAQHIADHCGGALTLGELLDKIRRLRRELPQHNKQAMAAFGGGECLAAALQHELDCLREDANAMAEWIKPTQEELQRLFTASLKGDDPAPAASRYGEALSAAFAECERQRQIVLESCNQAFLTANRVCTAADKAAEKPAPTPTTAGAEGEGGGQTDREADTKKKRRIRVPKNVGVLLALKKAIAKGARQGQTLHETAVEFTDGNLKKAKSLLRSLRRHRNHPGLS